MSIAWVARTVVLSCVASLVVACGAVTVEATPTLPAEESNMPTPASTLAQLMVDISSDDAAVRLVSTYALEGYGEEAGVAVPLLVVNLHDEDFDVRRAAAYVLGTLGPIARASVPDLVGALQHDSYIHVRVEAAEALGSIGDPTAVPALAQSLLDDIGPSYEVAIVCALSKATITGERFTDPHPGVYELDEDGVPLLVVDARNWWDSTGRFLDWRAD